MFFIALGPTTGVYIIIGLLPFLPFPDVFHRLSALALFAPRPLYAASAYIVPASSACLRPVMYNILYIYMHIRPVFHLFGRVHATFLHPFSICPYRLPFLYDICIFTFLAPSFAPSLFFSPRGFSLSRVLSFGLTAGSSVCI